MLKQIDILNAARAKNHKPSWYALRKTLQLDEPRLYAYRKRGVIMPDEIALQVADLAGFSRDYVLVCLAAERAGDTPSGLALSALADMIEGGQKTA